MGRRRLDAELVRRGLAASRSQAQEAVIAGRVTVAGITATKAASLVADDAPVALSGPPASFVSRGGGKLAAALDRFAVAPDGRDCLDAGASTGGFTPWAVAVDSVLCEERTDRVRVVRAPRLEVGGEPALHVVVAQRPHGQPAEEGTAVAARSMPIARSRRARVPS